MEVEYGPERKTVLLYQQAVFHFDCLEWPPGPQYLIFLEYYKLETQKGR